jgi:ATP-dependent Clp protease ATP-binding subunit ClpA
MFFMPQFQEGKMNNRKYVVINGSKKYFYKKLPDDNENISTFLELVKESDECKTKGENFNNHADILIITNDNYNGITEQAHDRIGAIIEELTSDEASIYIHNPPITLKDFLKNIEQDTSEQIEYKNEEYIMKKNEQDFVKSMQDVSKNIIGQNRPIFEISKSMWYLTKTERKKPYVIMLYGNSSLGKTELVREISEKFYNGELFEKHLSMFKNNTYSDYLFGEKPNRKTLVYDLLARSSNLIFLDELDKCPEHFYSAFYTLFDNLVFKDASYEVDTSGLLIILTSNYLSEKEMKVNLGLPIYYRIDKFILFNDFDSESIYRIVMKEINDRREEYVDLLTPESIYSAVSSEIQSQGENARTIKYKVQKVIEELLFRNISKN